MTPPPKVGSVAHLRQLVGESRAASLMTAHLHLAAMKDWSLVAVTAAWKADYSDEALELLKHDADDVVKAAEALRDVVHGLADDWRAQKLAQGSD